MNPLEEANEIVFKRSEEKERNYGPMDEGMREAATLATTLTQKPLTARDMYWCMIALKLSREAYAHKRDNIVDACAYLAAMSEYEGDEP